MIVVAMIILTCLSSPMNKLFIHIRFSFNNTSPNVSAYVDLKVKCFSMLLEEALELNSQQANMYFDTYM